jgi:hypothetical protein
MIDVKYTPGVLLSVEIKDDQGLDIMVLTDSEALTLYDKLGAIAAKIINKRVREKRSEKQ